MPRIGLGRKLELPNTSVVMGSTGPVFPTGRIAHWDAALGITTTGSLVDSWTDYIGGFIASSTGASRPTFNAANPLLNNLPSVDFVIKHLLSNLNLGGPHTIVIVTVPRTTNTSNGYLFGHNIGNPIRKRLSFNGLTYSWTTEYLPDNPTSAGAAGTTIISTSWELVANGFKNYRSVQGNLFFNQSTTTPTAARATAPIVIGGINTTTLRYFGDIAEAIVWDRAFSVLELQDCHTILNSKYNIT